MHFWHPTDEQLRLVDTHSLATTIILSTLNTRGTCYAVCFIRVSLRKNREHNVVLILRLEQTKGKNSRVGTVIAAKSQESEICLVEGRKLY